MIFLTRRISCAADKFVYKVNFLTRESATLQQCRDAVWNVHFYSSFVINFSSIQPTRAISRGEFYESSASANRRWNKTVTHRAARLNEFLIKIISAIPRSSYSTDSSGVFLIIFTGNQKPPRETFFFFFLYIVQYNYQDFDRSTERFNEQTVTIIH